MDHDAYKLPESSAGDDADVERRRPRKSVYFIGRLRIGRKSHACRIRNLSVGGALLEFDLPMPAAETGVLYIPRIGDVFGDLAWTTHKKAGFKFHVALATRQMAALHLDDEVKERPVLTHRRSMEATDQKSIDVVRQLRRSLRNKADRFDD
jgi:hypothetical protein